MVFSGRGSELFQKSHKLADPLLVETIYCVGKGNTPGIVVDPSVESNHVDVEGSGRIVH
jgi:hypothetical protein